MALVVVALVLPLGLSILPHNPCWNFERKTDCQQSMKLQELLPCSQLLIVEVKRSDHLCHFLFVGPPAIDTIFILNEDPQSYGVKDPSPFLKNSLFHCLKIEEP